MELRPCPSHPGWSVSECGTAIEHIRGKVYFMTCTRPNGKKYLSAAVNSPLETKQVARLVCDAWVEPAPPGKGLVCHKDDNSLNNHASNLYLGDGSTNVADAVKNGLRSYGEKANAAKFSDAEVREIRDLYATGLFTQAQIARAFGCRPATVCVYTKHGIRSMQHAKRTRQIGEDSCAAKFTDAEVIAIQQYARSGRLSIKQLAEAFNTSVTTVYNFRRFGLLRNAARARRTLTAVA